VQQLRADSLLHARHGHGRGGLGGERFFRLAVAEALPEA